MKLQTTLAPATTKREPRRTPPNILMIEDNPRDLVLLLGALKEIEWAADIRRASTGRKALSLLRRWNQKARSNGRPDLILLDLNLPRPDGRAVLAKIRSSAVLRRVPVIVWTSSQNPSDISTCAKIGADSYLLKPNNWDQFLETAEFLRSFWEEQTPMPPVWLAGSQENLFIPNKRFKNQSDPEEIWLLTRVHQAIQKVAHSLTESDTPPTPPWEWMARVSLSFSKTTNLFDRYLAMGREAQSFFERTSQNSPDLKPLIKSFRQILLKLRRNFDAVARHIEAQSRIRAVNRHQLHVALKALSNEIEHACQLETEIVQWVAVARKKIT